MLFSEPKIPQFNHCSNRDRSASVVSVLFSEPKIPQLSLRRQTGADRCVSVLFSEPKIPQFWCSATMFQPEPKSFSALQRAENSSIVAQFRKRDHRRRFQCSSASRKFLNAVRYDEHRVGFVFQCSSASRKFLNTTRRAATFQRARVSVLFSEPKIPQCICSNTSARRRCCFSALQRAENSSMLGRSTADRRDDNVSVLFSEPKIPQLKRTLPARCTARRFSALQRAENSSIEQREPPNVNRDAFQCSSASRKFLNYCGSYI